MIDVSMRPGSSSRCRVWLGELPDADYNASGEIIVQVAAQPNVLFVPKSVAIELWIASGPRQHYGLLGGTFQPEGSDHCVVKIEVTEASREVWNRPFGMTHDLCTKGLLREYAEGVEEGVRSKMAPAGILCINRAAHGETSSSPNMFRQLAKLLLTLLVLPEPPPIDTLTELAIRWAEA